MSFLDLKSEISQWMSQFWGTSLTNEGNVTSELACISFYCIVIVPQNWDIHCISTHLIPVFFQGSGAKVGCTCPRTQRFCTKEFTYFAGAKKIVTVFLLFGHFKQELIFSNFFVFAFFTFSEAFFYW